MSGYEDKKLDLDVRFNIMSISRRELADIMERMGYQVDPNDISDDMINDVCSWVVDYFWNDIDVDPYEMGIEDEVLPILKKQGKLLAK